MESAHLHRLEHYQPEKEGQDPAALLLNGHFNKATAFNEEERSQFRLRGLLPKRVETIQEQADRAMKQLDALPRDLEKYNYLQTLKHLNETLFYFLLSSNLSKLCPLVYTPVVGEACQNFGSIFRFPEGLYLTKSDRGQIRKILDNWTRPVAIIVVTDGSRILGLGDLGAGGMGIPIGKLSLYVAAAGFHPYTTLPIQLDLGCDNDCIREDPHYLGVREKRMKDEEYYPFLEEFCMAVKDKWPSCLLQFEDFSNNHCFDLLEKYRMKLRCFNDDIQGTGSVVASGFISAAKITKIPYKDQKIVFLGAGSAGIGVADQIVAVMVKEDPSLTPQAARERFYFVDSKGLVATTRKGELEKHKVPYARRDVTENLPTLLDVISHVKPTALIGLSGVGGSFTESVLKEMAKHHPRPIIFALSNPTRNSECTAEAAYSATEGRAIFASGSPFPNYTLPDGKILYPGQGNNMYIFPGLGFGAWLAQAKVVSDGMIIAATLTLSNCLTEEDQAIGRIYPSLERIRELSAAIAVKVIEVAFEEGLAGIDRPQDIPAFVQSRMYQPQY